MGDSVARLQSPRLSSAKLPKRADEGWAKRQTRDALSKYLHFLFGLRRQATPLFSWSSCDIFETSSHERYQDRPLCGRFGLDVD